MRNNRLLRALAISTAALVVTIAVIVVASMAFQEPGDDAVRATMDPRVIDNLTQMPSMQPLTGALADRINAIRAAVEVCPAYSPERRLQMEQQITLLLNPAAIPPDVIIALGANPHARLLFAIGTVTEIQWRLNERPPDSCLIPIGRAINDLLIEAGETPIATFSIE